MTGPALRSLVIAALAGIMAMAPWHLAAWAQPESSDVEFFEKKIRPVLVQHCYKCHSQQALAAKKLKGGLLLDSRAGIRKGGENGPAVVPGNIDESLLISALKYDEFEMPPAGRLPDTVVADFVQWVKAGAADPRDGEPVAARSEIDMEAGRRYWAFQPPVKHAPPQVTDARWPRDAIDRFILARLEAAGLKPIADASRETLVRRVYFDLLGLPPTPDEIDAFLNDRSADALAKVVDRLLASPHFGERWGRHWMDVARFAESSGGGRSLMFKNAWRYRDYVIGAYNKDKPLDAFIREQLAGDLLVHESPEQRAEQLAATGFLVLGPTNYELQDKQLLRMDVIDEQIDTTGRALLGMTLGCARCHDHKFDPIPTSDYYALAGIFGSTKTLTPGNVSGYVQQPLPEGDSERAARQAYQQQVAEITRQWEDARRQLAALQGKPAPAATAQARAGVRADSLPGIVLDNVEAQLVGEWQMSTHERRYVGEGYLHDQNTDKGAKSVTFTPKFATGGIYEVRLAYTPGGNRASNIPVTIDHQDGRTDVTISQAQDPPIDGMLIALGRYRFEADSRSAVTISNKDTDGYVIVDAVQFLPVASVDATSNDAAADAADPAVAQAGQKPGQVPPANGPNGAVAPADGKALAKAAEVSVAEQRVRELDAQLKALKKHPPAPPAMVMSVMDQPKPADEPIHIRGGARSLGPLVPRGYLTVATPPDGTPAAIAPGRSGRLELADWIASAQNPLTARVYVNRVWHHLFGSGIVRTTDNFGAMGERPSHGELLDYLAVRFMEEGWSTKKLVRQIVLSRVYQLSTQTDDLAADADPENRLLGRANRRRLDAEALRDAMLLVSGQLDRTAGGLTIKKLAEYDFGYEHGDSRLRSVYVPRLRNAMLDMFEVFDVANPNLVSGRRHASVLPTQALFLMNSRFVYSQAEHAARRLLAAGVSDDADRVELAFRWALGRLPTVAERQMALEHIRESSSAPAKPSSGDAEASLRAYRSLFQTLFACLDFRYID